MSKIYRPMLAGTKKVLFNSDWIHEIKYDGLRAIGYVKDKHITLINRSMIDITLRFPEISSNLVDLPDCVLDGEICCFNYNDDSVHSDFQLVQTRMNRLSDWEKHSKLTPAKFMVFDVLESHGNNICNSLLSSRKSTLYSLFEYHQSMYSNIHRVRILTEEQVALITEFQAEEGLVAKNIYSVYVPGYRSPNWVKLKFRKTDEFYVSGATWGTGKRKNTFGALDLYQKLPDGMKKECGQVGTGFTDVKLLELNDLMYHLCSGQTCDRKAFWKWWLPNEALKVRVSYLELSNNGIVRQASFVEIV